MANPRMTAEIGRVLGGRYRLVAPIGMGASAQVYLADDVKLRRRVALKMLHDALAGDAEFIRRFRAEARAAAALSHPNVMAVYDWGDGSEEGEPAFIVTEYLPGGSLRSLLDSGALLSPAQALGVGLEAARALDYAHRRGFVHRDIKPANLLFGEEQRLRIADFGLARALAEAAWTEPQGAVLGTARYASPEQAKGESLTGKADVYSLALVLVEAVTGDVPFVADTTLGTLMARVDRPLVVPDELGPLQAIVTAAGHPDPALRIDARRLAKGLLRAAGQLSRPAPLPLAGALAAGALAGTDADPTVHAPVPLAEADRGTDLTADDLELDPPHWVNQSDPTAVDLRSGPVPVVPAAGLAGALAAGADAVPGPLVVEGRTDGEPVVDLTAVDIPGAVLDDPAGPGTDQVGALAADDAPDDQGTSARRRWPWVALVVVLLLGGAGVAGALVVRDDPAAAGPLPTLPVPTLVGSDEAQARTIAEASGWKITVKRERRDDTTRGEVLETSPAAGTRLDDGRTLTLTVSEGQTIVDVPADLAGLTFDEAAAALDAVGLRAEEGETPYSEDDERGIVIGPVEGTPGRLERGSTVALVVSNGPEPRTVPSGLVGSTEAAAKEALEALGLVFAPVRSFSDDIAEGQVISVLPASGATVGRGESVSVEISRGPELVAVPDVSGAGSIDDAVAILEAQGLQAGNLSGPVGGTPQGTSPGAGELVRPGATIDIVLG